MALNKADRKAGVALKAFLIPEPKMETAVIPIMGIAPLMVNRFSQKARDMMEAAMMEGGDGAKRRSRSRIREARDFDADFVNAQYFAREGWSGIAASSFRNAMISACKVCGFPMTRAKLSIFVERDGGDKLDGTPLVRINDATPRADRRPVRNATGVADIRCRPMWEEGWTAKLQISWDGDQFNVHDVFNLLARAGLQVGVGEGRPDSKMSTGLGFGRWKIEQGGIANVMVRRVIN